MQSDAVGTVSDRLAAAVAKLGPTQSLILAMMAEGMYGEARSKPNPNSDIVTTQLDLAIQAWLLGYHALFWHKLNKVGFEYMLLAAFVATGTKARLNPNTTDASWDLMAAGVRFSLKTQADKGVSTRCVYVQKFSEALWIRRFDDPAELASQTKERILAHLSQYDRILVLKAFDEDDGSVRYHLVEIPKSVIALVEGLTPRDFPPKNSARGTSADVRDDRGIAFRVRLDGSVEKVRLFNIRMNRCILHGEWVIPRVPPSEDSGD